jgi:signal transduction histidine kinase
MRRVGSDFTDGVYALLLTVFAQLDLRFNIDQSHHYGSAYAVAVCTAAATAAIALRRRAPLLCAIAVAGAVSAPELFTTLTITLWGDFVPLLIATYAVARYATGRRAWSGVGVLIAAVVVIMVRVPSIGTRSNIPFTFVPFVLVLIAARWQRRQEAQHLEAGRRALELEAERETSIQSALAEERGRIARELHDIVAHALSVIVVQAGAADDVFEHDPARARGPIRAIDTAARAALADLRRVLGILQDPAEYEPQPGLDQLDRLIDQIRATGLHVSLEVEGSPRPLSAAVELSAFRIVQEALTNSLKHAAAEHVRVRIRYGDKLELEIRDDGAGDGNAASGTAGSGLIGMRERVALLGGVLAAGATPGGGYRVAAEIPIEAS